MSCTISFFNWLDSFGFCFNDKVGDLQVRDVQIQRPTNFLVLLHLLRGGVEKDQSEVIENCLSWNVTKQIKRLV